jgi:hypothetical protein
MAYSAWSVSQDEVPNAAKWNELGSNDAHFYDFLGDNLEWQSWTPTHTHTTVGNGTEEAYYIQIGKTVFFKYRLKKQSTTAIGTYLDFSPPVPMHADYNTYFTFMGSAYLEDYLVTGHMGFSASEQSSDTIVVSTGIINTTYMARTSVTGTVPFTAGNNDYYSCVGFYEAA